GADRVISGLWLVVDLDVELNVAGVHTGDSNVDAVGLIGIRQFVLKPNPREEPVRSRTHCAPYTKRPPRPTKKRHPNQMPRRRSAFRNDHRQQSTTPPRQPPAAS